MPLTFRPAEVFDLATSHDESVDRMINTFSDEQVFSWAEDLGSGLIKARDLRTICALAGCALTSALARRYRRHVVDAGIN